MTETSTARGDGSTVPVGGRGGWWVAAQIVLIVVAAIAGVVGPAWPEAPRTTLRVVGWPLVGIGALVLATGGAGLGASLTPFPRPVAHGELQQGGMYRFVRHPMYGGGLVLVLGWALASSPVVLALLAALAVLFERKSRREEAWLVERYPGYPAYRDRTRWKFVPGLR